MFSYKQHSLSTEKTEALRPGLTHLVHPSLTSTPQLRSVLCSAPPHSDSLESDLHSWRLGTSFLCQLVLLTFLHLNTIWLQIPPFRGPHDDPQGPCHRFLLCHALQSCRHGCTSASWVFGLRLTCTLSLVASTHWRGSGCTHRLEG